MLQDEMVRKPGERDVLSLDSLGLVRLPSLEHTLGLDALHLGRKHLLQLRLLATPASDTVSN
jgi:hypothetical protein